MDTLIEIFNLFNDHVFRGIFISVLLIILTRRFFKKIDTKNAILIIKWLMIVGSIVIVLKFLFFIIFSNEKEDHVVFMERITGPYRVAYWFMFGTSLLPLLLFYRKLSNNIYLILAIAFLMNAGWLFESFVIHISSFHRDYSGEGNNYRALLPFRSELLIIFKGAILGILALVVGNLIHSTKK